MKRNSNTTLRMAISILISIWITLNGVGVVASTFSTSKDEMIKKGLGLVSNLKACALSGPFSFWTKGSDLESSVEEEWQALLDCTILFEVKGKRGDAFLPAKLSLQWVLLKNATWRIKFHDKEEVEIKPKESPYSSAEQSEIFWNLPDLAKATPHEIFERLVVFQNQIFPAILRADALVDTLEPLRARLNFLSRVVAFEQPIRSAKYRYPDVKPMAVRPYYSYNWSSYLKVDRKFNGLSQYSVSRSFFWPKMLGSFFDLEPIRTSCLELLESKLTRAFMLLVEHPDFFEKIFEGRSRKFGVLADTARKNSDKGLWEKVAWFNLEKEISSTKSFLLGQALFFRSINESSLDNDFYFGMNGIIHDMTESAYQDLRSIKTLGGERRVSGDYIEDEFEGEIRRIEASLEGVSKILFRYWKDRRDLENDFSWNEAKVLAYKKYIDRPFFNETKFEPVIFSLMSLANWVEKLYEENPRTPYQLFAYRYMPTSFYRHVVETAESFSGVDEIKDYKKPDFREMSKTTTGYSWQEVKNRFLDLFR